MGYYYLNAWLHGIYVKVLNNETQLVRKILDEMDTSIKKWIFQNFGYRSVKGTKTWNNKIQSWNQLVIWIFSKRNVKVQDLQT